MQVALVPKCTARWLMFDADSVLMVGPCVECRSKWLAKLSDPWVRLVDPLIGEAVGMRVDVDLEDGTTAAGVFVHKKLSDSVG